MEDRQLNQPVEEQVDEHQTSGTRVRIANHQGFIILECSRKLLHPAFADKGGYGPAMLYKLTKKDAKEIARLLIKSAM